MPVLLVLVQSYIEQETSDGKTAPVAFASIPTSLAEQKFAATELEVAGLVFSLEHFEVHVLGNQVTVYTSHQALVKSYLPYLKSQTKGSLVLTTGKISPNSEIRV